jgi:hypothetical protein
MSGRIVASWTPWQRQGERDHRLLDERLRGEADLWWRLSYLRSLARRWRGSRIYFAVAPPGEHLFVCKTMWADKRRIRVTDGWRFPNGNILFSSNGVLGVRRQLNRRGRG